MDTAAKIQAAAASLTVLPKEHLEKLAIGEWFTDATRTSWLVIRPNGTVDYKNRPLTWKIEEDGKLSITNGTTGQVASWRISGNTYLGTDWEGKPCKGMKRK